MKQFFTIMILGIILTVGFGSYDEAYATILFGGVTGGTSFTNGGTFMNESPPPITSGPPCGVNSVGENCQNTHDLWGFDEDQNIILGSALAVNEVVVNGVEMGPGLLPSGSTVASHYIYYDPLGSSTIAGFVDFDSDIVAIITATTELTNSDFLANTGVTYLSPGLRGLEGGDSVVAFDADTISISWSASSPGDYIRVLTEFSPAAEPSIVAGDIIPIEQTSLLLAGLQTSAIWLAPVVISAVGLGIVLVRRK